MTRRLRRDLAGHEVHTVAAAGLKGLENGELLKAAAGIYEVLITVDQNILYQQNLGGLTIAILILAAKRNSYTRLKPLMPRALVALQTIRPGEIIRIEA